MTKRVILLGWELRDCMMWLYGSGFPKSLDISKAIDKAKGAEREVIGQRDTAVGNGGTGNNFLTENSRQRIIDVTVPATDLSRQWSGWGTALKPAWEPIIVAMKPIGGTFAENAEKWGVAGLNVDGGRIVSEPVRKNTAGGLGYQSKNEIQSGTGTTMQTIGRWPANLILDEEAGAMLDERSGVLKSGAMNTVSKGFGNSEIYNDGKEIHLKQEASSGGASRFFYCAKASKSERGGDNVHPTVKPIKLMEYLCTLTKTPTGGIVLDPFAGSGTTGLACANTGRKYILIEREQKYIDIILARLEGK